MRHYRFLQLDVFTERAFNGNPLAVFPEAEGLDAVTMQQIAREMNLSETVFVLPSNDERALRRLRIFTPTSELPFAGHPVVGTWNMLAREGVVPMPEGGSGTARIQQEVGIGVLPVEIDFREGEPARVVMTQGKFTIHGEGFGPQRRELLARALGLAPEELDQDLPVHGISTGNMVLAVPVRTLEALGRCHVNPQLLSEAYGDEIFLGCYAFTRETRDGNASRAHARGFFPGQGIMEDPATGSAAGPLAGYMVHHGVLEGDDAATQGNGRNRFRFVIEQGDFMGRPSRIEAEVKGERGSVEEVRVGGSSVVVARGELMF